MKKRSIHEDQDRGAAPMCEAPVYINVAGHFACLLLEDGVPLQPSCVSICASFVFAFPYGRTRLDVL